MRAVVDEAVEERRRARALAHETALHVREGDDERVDLAAAHLLAQHLEAGGAVDLRLAHSASRSVPSGGQGWRDDPRPTIACGCRAK